MQIKEKINALGSLGIPFVFCIDYTMRNGFVYELDSMPDGVAFCIEGKNYGNAKSSKIPKIIEKNPITKTDYLLKINAVKEKIALGDIYMANLTAPTKITLDGSLEDVFCASKSDFKLLVKDKFVVSSPEAFIEIAGNKISTYPIKGTAAYNGDKSVETLLKNAKELSEHTMTVDLLRNDLSIVASSVKVDNFRYPIIIEANGKKLIQIASKISGKLPSGYLLGDTIFALLPAGSITGTPKKKCVETLIEIEKYERGFFCGIFGYFDGQRLKSGVSIRYIEQTNEDFIYKSGGGITFDSNEASEYEEMLEKVYLAF